VTLKNGLRVRQGHWKYHPSIERVRLPIDICVSRFIVVLYLNCLYASLAYGLQELNKTYLLTKKTYLPLLEQRHRFLEAYCELTRFNYVRMSNVLLCVYLRLSLFK